MSTNSPHENDQNTEPDEVEDQNTSVAPEEGEDVSEVPMLQEPRRQVGHRDAQFTPQALYALTRQERADIDPHDDGIFLVEEPIDRIDKRGIQFGGEWYWSRELMEHVTGSPDVPTPNYFIRYDRALYARGTLDEVLLYREEAGGQRRRVCRCKPREEAVGEEIDHEEFLHRRNQYLKRLQAQGSLADHEFNMLQMGLKKAEELLDQQAARRRNARNHAPEPRPAAPVDLGAEQERDEPEEENEDLTFGEERAREREREQ